MAPPCLNCRDGRDKPGHDERGNSTGKPSSQGNLNFLSVCGKLLQEIIDELRGRASRHSWEGPMKLPRRQFLRLAAGATALPALSRLARAQAYPARPVTMIVPFAAGGPNDGIARIMAERMRVSLGQPVTIENIDGAAGSIGTGRAARAAPDGYTISIGYWGTHVANSAIYAL